MSLKRILSAALASAVVITSALTFSGCADTSVAGTIEGVTIPAGIYVLNEFEALSQAVSDFKDANPDTDVDAEGFDFFAQTIDGKSFSDYVKDTAAQNCKNYVAVEKMFDEMGLVIDAADKEKLIADVNATWDNDNTYAQIFYGVNTYGEYYEKNGIGKNSYKEYMLNSKKAEMIFEAIYCENGSKEVPQAEIEKWIEENYTVVRYISVSKKDKDGKLIEDETKLAELKTLAEGYAEEINGGAKFSEVYNKHQKHIEATEVEVEEEKELDRIISVESTNPSEEFVKHVYEMELDKAEVYDADTYYYVVIRYDILTDDYKETYKHTALNALKGDEMKATLEAAAANYSVSFNDATLEQFSPEALN